jgi:hypothetical protein
MRAFTKERRTELKPLTIEADAFVLMSLDRDRLLELAYWS